MKIATLFSITSLCVLAGAVHAETFYLNVSRSVPVPAAATPSAVVQSPATTH